MFPQNHRDCWQTEDEECAEVASAVVLESCQRDNNNGNSTTNNNNGKSIDQVICAPQLESFIDSFTLFKNKFHISDPFTFPSQCNHYSSIFFSSNHKSFFVLIKCFFYFCVIILLISIIVFFLFYSKLLYYYKESI